MRGTLGISLLCTVLISAVSAEEAQTVNVGNFCRAESDRYFAQFAQQGGFGRMASERELAPIDHQTVIRMNRDTLYSFGVFDLDAGPVTVTLPDAGKRYMALQVIDEDQYAPYVFYAPGTHTLTNADIGTRYVALAVRTFVDPNDPADMKAAHALQDAIRAEQKTAGTLDLPKWDPGSLDKMRQALLGVVAANGGLESTRMFGSRSEVDPIEHLLGTAAGWGGNPRSAAIYVGVVPPDNNGRTAYTLTLQDVPVDGFWSVSVYNKEGYFQANPQHAYTVNNVTARPNLDGSATIHFGGDAQAPNFLPITPGWNYLVRLYRPRPEILDGRWKLPEAQPVK